MITKYGFPKQMTQEPRPLSWRKIIIFAIFAVLVLVISLVISNKARAEMCPTIDMSIIATIESSNNPLAYNKASGARGMYQITKIALLDYNAWHKGQEIALNELYSPKVARSVANWYLAIRIPQMLRYYGLTDTLENRLWAYNAGIGRVVKGIMPNETKNYIAKYTKLQKGQVK